MENRFYFCFLLVILLISNTSFAFQTDAERHHDIGIKLYMRGDYYGALAEFTKAIEIDPNFDRAYSNRGLMWQLKGDYDRAMADFNKAIEINPKLSAAYDGRGCTWRFKGDFDRAIADLTTAIELNPNKAIPYNNRGSAYMNNGDFISALADFNKAIELDSKFATAYYNRGCTLYRQGRFKESLPDLRKALEGGFNPGDYAYLMLLIASQKVSKEDYEKVAGEFEKFVRTRSSSAWIRRIIVFYIHENVPEQMIILGAKEGGRSRLERLCEAYYYLGEYRLSKGDKRGAEDHFLKCLETNVFTTAEYLNAKAMLKLLRETKL